MTAGVLSGESETIDTGRGRPVRLGDMGCGELEKPLDVV